MLGEALAFCLTLTSPTDRSLKPFSPENEGLSLSHGGFKHGLTEGIETKQRACSSLARLLMKFLETKRVRHRPPKRCQKVLNEADFSP